MKRAISLRLKLTLGTMAVLALALVVCCFFIIGASRQVLENTAILLTEKEEASLLERLSDQLGKLGAGQSKAALRYAFGVLGSQAEAGSSYVLQQGETHFFNNSGISPESLLNFSEESTESAATKTQFCTLDGKEYCVSGRRFRYFDENYTVSVVRDVTEHMSQVRALELYCSLISGAVIMAAGCFLVLFLAVQLRPLRVLQQNAAAIAAGDYSCRGSVHRKDELGMVSESFNLMAQAVQSHIAAVEATSQERSTLLHALAHEMRTPVTAISGYAYALTHMRMNEEQREEALDFVESESRRLERLYTKLTELITVTDQKVPLSPIKPEELQTRILAILSPMAEKQGIRLDVNLGNSTFLGDMDLLVMLITNLYDNARKAGAETLKITMAEGILSVKDDGCGIPKEIQDKIMQPFYQGDISRNQEGFGLGLSLCRRIAFLHGSDLTVESAPGEGCTFTTLLQLHDDSQTAREVG